MRLDYVSIPILSTNPFSVRSLRPACLGVHIPRGRFLLVALLIAFSVSCTSRAFSDKLRENEVMQRLMDSAEKVERTSARSLQFLETEKQFTVPVFFELGKADLTAEAIVQLTDVVDHLHRQSELPEHPAGEVVWIEGHTCDLGPVEVNMRLSKERAETVKEFLIARGLHDFTFKTRGRGSAQPIVANSSEENRIRNRRVSFIREGLETETTIPNLDSQTLAQAVAPSVVDERPESKVRTRSLAALSTDPDVSVSSTFSATLYIQEGGAERGVSLSHNETLTMEGGDSKYRLKLSAIRGGFFTVYLRKMDGSISWLQPTVDTPISKWAYPKDVLLFPDSSRSQKKWFEGWAEKGIVEINIISMDVPFDSKQKFERYSLENPTFTLLNPGFLSDGKGQEVEYLGVKLQYSRE